LVHYHLRPGGVTSVLYHQARSLTEAGDEVLIIAGEGTAEGLPVKTVEALGYDRFRGARPGEADQEAARKLADALIKAMEDHWGTAADVFHVHNPLIQKNAALIPALNILNQRGIRLLLQIHDLAEDFRPDVYAAADYPENCHYGVINNRDFSFLHRAGLRPDGLHLIPNEVFPPQAVPGLPRTRYLYPVRAIRRKNIGEALLLSLFIPRGKTVTVTLPPTTERDQWIYRRWVRTAGELKLPVEFEAGLTHTLGELMGGARCVITTSVKEGFGFSFLEPWTADRAVIGRRIDYVCRDFEAAGVRFDSLYSSLNIPMVYISPGTLKNKMEHTMTAVYRSFGMDPPDYMLAMMGGEILSRDMADFGCLDEELQESIIRIMASNEAIFREIRDANPFLAGLADWRGGEDLIAANGREIRVHYGTERICSILKDIYSSVVNNPVRHKLSKSMLLDLYLDPLKFSLIGVAHA
jgi:hypothetical protein